MRIDALVASVCCAIGAPLAAHACSEFSLAAQPVEPKGYNPNSQSPVALQIDLFLIDGPAERSCGSHIVEITSSSINGVRDLTDGSAIISGMIPPGQSTFASHTDTTIRLSPEAVDQLVSTGRLIFQYAWIKAGIYYPAGLYTNVIDVEVNGIEVTTLEPEITVFPSMRLLSDMTNGYGKIDFGTLESDEEVASSFVYQSNAKLTVTAFSLNNGKLAHEDGASIYAIPYSARINDHPIALDGSQDLSLDSNSGSYNMGSVRLRLGDIGVPTAGEYADILTLSFTTD